ncbi:Uncharacterized protein Fot_55998 [Forsythia ovata]|uniref:Uncharacterized protein n=1 Tax=Forsythia ovata TaxID=205694 RepID=A0ABD1P256_9LAMI
MAPSAAQIGGSLTASTALIQFDSRPSTPANISPSKMAIHSAKYREKVPDSTLENAATIFPSWFLHMTSTPYLSLPLSLQFCKAASTFIFKQPLGIRLDIKQQKPQKNRFYVL